MSLPIALGQAAKFGALVGIGGELVALDRDSSGRGLIFVGTVVAAVALRTMVFYLGICGTAGALLGAYLGVVEVQNRVHRAAEGEMGVKAISYLAMQAIGKVVLATTIGYLIGQIPVDLVPVIRIL